MAKIKTITTVGENLTISAIGSGTNVQIDRIVAGKVGHVTTLAAAKALTAMPTATGNDLVGIDNPFGRVADNSLQVQWSDTPAVDYGVTQFGLFVGSDLYGYICDDAGANITVLSAGRTSIESVEIVVTDEQASVATFANTYLLIPPATDDVLGGVTLNSIRSIISGLISSIGNLSANVITSGQFSIARIPNIPWSKITGKPSIYKPVSLLTTSRSNTNVGFTITEIEMVYMLVGSSNTSGDILNVIGTPASTTARGWAASSVGDSSIFLGSLTVNIGTSSYTLPASATIRPPQGPNRTGTFRHCVVRGYTTE